MSFADKRKARSVREQKSYIPSAARNDGTHEGPDAGSLGPVDTFGDSKLAPNAISASSTASSSGSDKPKESSHLQAGPLYAQLPDGLEIKSSKERGRGLWTKVDIKAGKWKAT